jgi:hypothetical protein
MYCTIPNQLGGGVLQLEKGQPVFSSCINDEM